MVSKFLFAVCISTIAVLTIVPLVEGCSGWTECRLKTTLDLCGKDANGVERISWGVKECINQGKKGFQDFCCNHNEEPMDLPSLHQLIIQEKDTSFDDSRWSLFQWILNFDDQFILNVRNNFESNFMRIVSYTLKLLLLNKSISFREADIIFLAEWNIHNQSTHQNQRATIAPPPAVPFNRNVTPLFVPVNWRESNNYMLSMQPVATVNFQGMDRRPPLIISNWRDRNDRNERRPHNWSNYNSRARTNLPTQLTDPKFIDRTWIQTAHKYTIAFESVCHCLELCGLRKETDLIRFDALDFHAKMRLDKRGNEKIDAMVTKIRNIRFYC